MKKTLFTLLLMLALSSASSLVFAEPLEIGFPDGIFKNWNVDLGRESGSPHASCYSLVMPDGKKAVCLEGLFETSGTYVRISRGFGTPIPFRAINVQMARGDLKTVGAFLTDESGQTFLYEYTFPDMNCPRTAFQTVKMTLSSGTRRANFGGANDGQWHGNLKRVQILLGVNNADINKNEPKAYFRSIVIE